MPITFWPIMPANIKITPDGKVRVLDRTHPLVRGACELRGWGVTGKLVSLSERPLFCFTDATSNDDPDGCACATVAHSSVNNIKVLESSPRVDANVYPDMAS